MRHLANTQYWDRPAGGNTGRLFLAFGGPVCADRFSNCPLDRVLTYKNLIYLLNLQFCRLQVRSQDRPGPTDTGPLAEPSRENIRDTVTAHLPGPAVYVPDRFANSHREASSPRPSSNEAHTVAPQKQLAGARVSGKDYSNPQVSSSPLTLVVRQKMFSKANHYTQ